MEMSTRVAEMQGIGKGNADLHYGNNVDLEPEQLFRITVTLNSQRAVFRIRV